MQFRLVKIGLPITLIVTLALVILIYMSVPRKLTLLTGPRELDSYKYGELYAKYMQKQGVRVNVVETEGSLENLERLVAGSSSTAAFVQSGIAREASDRLDLGHLESLGSLFLEPFWLFSRADLEFDEFTDLLGKRVALGPDGSGARAIARILLHENRLPDSLESEEFHRMSPEEASKALLEGRIDAAFFVGHPDLPLIAEMIYSDSVVPHSLDRVSALTMRNPDLAAVTFPEGLFDLVKIIPTEDIKALAPAVNLVIRDDIPEPLIDLLLDAARSVHREPGMVSGRGDFPNMKYVSLPVSEAAVRYYEQGPSPTRRFLPYWLATFVDRLVVWVLPVLSGAFVFLKLVPGLFYLRFNMKIMGHYKRLERIEKARSEGEDQEVILAELAMIEKSSAGMRVPRKLISSYFELRQNIHDMAERLTRT